MYTENDLRRTFVDDAYCEIKHLPELVKATTFTEVGDVMISVLDEMHQKDPGTPIWQVCGPISTGGLGSVELNLLRLERAVHCVRSQGFRVFNQLPTESALGRLLLEWKKRNPPDAYPTELLDDCYGRLFRTGKIYGLQFVDDWKSSRGSIWEYKLAIELNMEVEYLPIGWE